MSKQPNPVGRPSQYRPEYCEKIIEFFNIEPFKTVNGKEVPNNLPHLVDFAHKIGVTHETILTWSKTFPEFSLAYKKAKQINESMFINNTLRGLYNSGFAIFMAKNKFGWRDEQHVKANIETIIKFSFDKDKLPAGNRLREYVTD